MVQIANCCIDVGRVAVNIIGEAILQAGQTQSDRDVVYVPRVIAAWGCSKVAYLMMDRRALGGVRVRQATRRADDVMMMTGTDQAERGSIVKRDWEFAEENANQV